MAPRTQSIRSNGDSDNQLQDDKQAKKEKLLKELDIHVQKQRQIIQKQVDVSIMRIEEMARSLLSKMPKDVGNAKIDDLFDRSDNLNGEYIRQQSIEQLSKAVNVERGELMKKFTVEAKVKVSGNPRPLKRWASDNVVNNKTVVKPRKVKSTTQSTKTTELKKSTLKNRPQTRTLAQQEASKKFNSVGNIPEEVRAFSAISSATGQLPKKTKSLNSPVRRPYPGERVYLVSETGTPLSNLEAKSLPTFLYPLQDGSNIAISRADEFNSLGYDAQKKLRLANQKLASIFRRVPVGK